MELVLFGLGLIIALFGFFLCVTGAPAVTATNFLKAIPELPARFWAGVILILIGGTMMGANFADVIKLLTGSAVTNT